MKNNTLSLTVGITTCYGEKSILETVRSVRNSVGIGAFRFIIVADRIPIKPQIKRDLKKYHVELVENKTESGQVAKQKQIVAMCKSDILIFTQDDVLLDVNALATVIARFETHPKTTLISIANIPLPATNLFERGVTVGTNITNRVAKSWSHGDNYLSVIGRFVACRSDFFKSSIQISDKVVSSDAYYYFANKFNKGIYEFIDTVSVYFKNPQNMKEHLRKSSRFQYSEQEMESYFRAIKKEYKTPKYYFVKALLQEFLGSPINFGIYLGIYVYTRIAKLNIRESLNAVWAVDHSTKNIRQKAIT